MITQISYNVLIERFRAFADGHFLIKGFTHGHPSNIDIEKGLQFPWMHVYPVEVEPRQGTRLYSFIVTFADLPRDKETPAEYEREVISDCIKLAEDLIAEIQNGLTLFGPTVELEGSPSIEVFIQEYSQTLTGMNLALTLSVPWDWSACDIPADWSVGGSGSGGTGSGGLGVILETNGVVNDEQTLLNLIDGDNVTLEYLGNGRVRFNSTGGGGVWGAITGVLTNQTDLVLALAQKANVADLGAVAFSNNYNDLDNLPSIPAPQVNSDWNASSGVAQILNRPTLAPVATSGDYNDLDNLPTIPTATSELTNDSGFITLGDVPPQQQADWNETDNTQVDFIKNKPTIPVNLDDLGDVNTPAPTNGQLLTYNTATGKWIASTLSGLPPTGAAGGDLQGTYPNPVVHQIHGIEMQAGTPTAGDVWLYEGAPAKWQHQPLPASHVTNDSSVTGSKVNDALNHLSTTKVESNAAITGATATKITYDAKGLVTSGTSLAASDIPSGIDAAKIGTGAVSNTEFGYLDGVSSAIQTQLNGKQNTIGLTTVGTNLATLPNPSAVRFLRINADNSVTARTAAEMVSDLGVGGGSTSVLYQFANGDTVVASTTRFGALFGGSVNHAAVDTARRTPMITAGTLSRFYVMTNTAQPATGSLVINVRKNSVDQALTITIAAGSAAGIFSDLVNSVSVVAGDQMGIKLVNNATTASAGVLNYQVLLTI